MTSTIFHLTNNDYPNKRYAIEQGASFNWLTLITTDDLTAWVPSGQIRTNYAVKGGVVKAVFNFEPLVLGEVTLPTNGSTVTGTIIKPYLTSQQTLSLDWDLLPRNGTDGIPGKNVWVYDIELASPESTVIRLLEGFVEVSLEVTRL